MERRVKFLALAVLLPALFISCVKSSNLGGASSSGSGGGFGNSLNGNAAGGLSPISGATVSLLIAGNSTPIANATTSSTGSFSLAFTNPGSGLLYVTVTGGNAGSGTNSNIKMMAIAGPATGVPSSILVNEATTAATSVITFNMGLFNDTNGTVTLNAPKNSAGVNNVATQYNNLIITSGTTVTNSGNSNVTVSMTNSVYTMANAFAACIENSSNCASLFNAATTSTGAIALNLMDAANNMLNNSANDASSVYTIAFPLNSTTGYPLTSATIPGGFTFNNTLPIKKNTFPVGSGPLGLAIDASGNVWVTNNGGTTVTELSSSGATVGTFTAGTGPYGIVIDASGNAWVANNGSNNVTELSPAGGTVGTFSVGTNPIFLAIDGAGNVWVTNNGSNNVTELSSTGTTLGTFSAGTGPKGIAIDGSGNLWISNNVGSSLGTITELSSSGVKLATTFLGTSFPSGLAFDPTGNLWITNTVTSNVTKLSTAGAVVGTFAITGNPSFLAIDQSGNVWVDALNGVAINELSPSGVKLAIYTPGVGPESVVIDQLGNVWAANNTPNTVTEFTAVTNGPQFFPYSGPIFP